MNRITHLGLGNFHRAHQAWYTANCDGWSITGVVMRNTALRDALAAQDNRYALGTWDGGTLHTQIIAVYDAVLLASEQPTEVIASIAHPETHVVTLTVTEKGYALDATNRLDLTDPAIAQDLASDTPQSTIGLLAAGLVARAGQGGGAITIISCDNLADNGHKLGGAVRDYLAQKHPQTLEWLAAHATFPNCMVDRITPRLSDAAITEIAQASGTPGLSCVGTEGFSEWVIEDRFAGPKPPWDSAGAVFVPDVSSFEDRKLRLLNASHSYLAYAGLLAGHTYVSEAIADPVLRAGVNALWDEAGATIAAPAADTLDDYRTALLSRFANPDMRHSLAQIAMDGSLKLRERLVPILTARADMGLTSPQTCRAIGTWMGFVHHTASAQTPLADPLSDTLTQIARTTQTAPDFAAAIAPHIGCPTDALPAIIAAAKVHLPTL